jgi:hypothetical protein
MAVGARNRKWSIVKQLKRGDEVPFYAGWAIFRVEWTSGGPSLIAVFERLSHDQIGIHNIRGPEPLVKCAWVGDPVSDESLTRCRCIDAKVKPLTVPYEKPQYFG